MLLGADNKVSLKFQSQSTNYFLTAKLSRCDEEDSHIIPPKKWVFFNPGKNMEWKILIFRYQGPMDIRLRLVRYANIYQNRWDDKNYSVSFILKLTLRVMFQLPRASVSVLYFKFHTYNSTKLP